MKNKIKSIAMLFLLMGGRCIMAQNIQLLMSPKPSPYLSDWQERTETVKLILTNTSTKDILVKIKTELFDGKGTLIASTNASKMPILTVNPGTTVYNAEDVLPGSAINYYGQLATGIITTGRIPDDNYRICTALTDAQTDKPVGTSGTVCKSFTIAAYQAPILISPANKSILNENQIKSVLFKWTNLIPIPPGNVNYRLQVWEVLEGQTGMIAMRSNQPIIEKDLKNSLQTQWPTEFALPETGRNYVWSILALDPEGRKLVDGLGYAEPFEFRMAGNDIDTEIDSLKVDCCVNGKQKIYFTIKNNLNFADISLSHIYINGVNGNTGTPYPIDISSSISPSLPYNYLPPSSSLNGGRKNFIAEIGCIENMQNIIIKSVCERTTSAGLIRDEDLETDTLHCFCDDCKQIKVDSNGFTVTQNGLNGEFKITGNLSANIPIYGFEFQLQSYSFSASPSSCTQGVASIEQSGVFFVPGSKLNGNQMLIYNETVSGSPNTNNGASKIIIYKTNTPMTGSIPVELSLGLPAPLAGFKYDCCKINYQVCIKVRVFYDAQKCKSCTYRYCFNFNNK